MWRMRSNQQATKMPRLILSWQEMLLQEEGTQAARYVGVHERHDARKTLGGRPQLPDLPGAVLGCLHALHEGGAPQHQHLGKAARTGLLKFKLAAAKSRLAQALSLAMGARRCNTVELR